VRHRVAHRARFVERRAEGALVVGEAEDPDRHVDGSAPGRSDEGGHRRRDTHDRVHPGWGFLDV